MKERLERLLSARVDALDTVRGGGYTQAGRYRAAVADGRVVFVKAAVDELTAGWLREEHIAYAHLDGPYISPLLAWEDDDLPVLVIPYYEDAFAAPPWTRERVDAVRASLDLLHDTPSPPEIPPVERFAEMSNRWDVVAADPEPFLSLRLCTRRWLDENLPYILEAAHTTPLAGNSVLHFDVRGDNTAFVDGRAIFVDWNWCSRGNPDLDRGAWLPSVHAEGGPAPDSLYDGDARVPAWIAGVWAAVAGTPPPATAGPRMREAQLAQLRVALPWACRALGLPPPDGG